MMTKKQLHNITWEYIQFLTDLGVHPLKENSDVFNKFIEQQQVFITHRDDIDGYCLLMLDKIQKMIDVDVMWDKANRWIGFVQAMLCQRGYFSINQLREHTRNGTLK